MKTFSSFLLGVAVATVVAVIMQVGIASSSPSGINIHNIQKSFDAGDCEVTITWDTDECTTTNLVRWGDASCQSPNYLYTESTSTGAGRSHSATFSVSAATGTKISFQVESSNACDTQTSGCNVATSGPCF